MESPPKRMTRARAAKTTEPTVKTTKIVTAAARAKASVSIANTKSTSTKRKTPADEIDDEDADELEDNQDLAKKPTRGRPRKIADTEAQPPATKTTARGRPAKKAATASSKAEVAPTKATRGRPKKQVSEADALDNNSQPPTAKTVRSRVTASKPSTKSSRPTTRKVVKFQEPDKENDGPLTSKEPATSSGMRARPARRAPATSSRTTKTGTKDMATSSAKPLSPKKVTQIPISRMDSSEDELAGGDTPLKRMQKQPMKPPSDLPISPRKPSAATSFEEAEDNTMTVNNAILNPPEIGATSLGSPARRPPTSPFKDSMKSPARKMGSVPLPSSMMKSRNAGGDRDLTSPSKSLLQSAAKRPQSPIKGLSFVSINQSQQQTSPLKSSVLQSPAKRALPGHKPRQLSPEKSERASIEDTPRMKPIMSSPLASSSRRPSEKLLENEMSEGGGEDEEAVFTGPVGSLKFPGRLSAVLPRKADPAEAAGESHIEAPEDQPEATDDATSDMVQPSGDDGAAPVSLSPPASAEDIQSAIQRASLTPVNPLYQLRAKDLDPCHDMNWESEDDLSPTKGMDVTTSSFTRSPSKSRRVTMGLSSLADQLDSWSPADPIEQQVEPETVELSETVEATESHPENVVEAQGDIAASPLPAVNAFFEQEMSARPSLSSTALCGSNSSEDQAMGEPILEDIMITDEDIELANEANEMSLKEPDYTEDDAPERSFSDEISEASQEYADENQIPVDPGLSTAAATAHAPITPVRPAPKVFNTTTKVPLKPADDSTPSPVKKRSFSASRVAPRRPSGPTRNATVISYQPTKTDVHTAAHGDATAMLPSTLPSTPAKSDIWSSMGTPARTPRRDVNPDMLRGAVVFVDVHTSEGADASGIFVDLLNQMGARCVKTWNWAPESDGSSTKCGITHVVFKDGGKRTMERVRQANGVVHCVGVTWVLDCERENEWLDEAPYYIDRSFVPRGGARRRKSMEPKALANMNGTLVNSGNGKAASTRDTQSVPRTPMNRRQSTLWMHTPSDQGEDAENDDDYEWSKFLILTPVPKTPAPEAVARYAADIPTSPSEGSMNSSPTQEDLLMRTCPPKSGKFRDVDVDMIGTCLPKANTYEDLGVGILGRDKDEHVRMRLMAARRKSLQFAPKVGSPLARTWK